MSRIETYKLALRALTDWEPYLLAESGLPGPRGNLELAQAVAGEGSEAQFRRWLALGPDNGTSPSAVTTKHRTSSWPASSTGLHAHCRSGRRALAIYSRSVAFPPMHVVGDCGKAGT